jgi:uncharacterized membrane protein
MPAGSADHQPAFLGDFLRCVGAVWTIGRALPSDERSALPGSLAAFVLYVFVVVSTLAVNVPRNDGIKRAGDPDEIADLGAVRQRFDERPWMRWNAARAVMSLAEFACLLRALVEFSRST